MNCNDNYTTTYTAAHRFIPPVAFESNVRMLKLHWSTKG